MNVLCIGDSWTWGQNCQHPWTYYLGNLSGYSVDTYAQGGCGFVRLGDGNNFQTKLRQAINEHGRRSNAPKAYDLVILLGGVNESGMEYANSVPAAISSMAQMIYAEWPNAMFHVFYQNWGIMPWCPTRFSIPGYTEGASQLFSAVKNHTFMEGNLVMHWNARWWMYDHPELMQFNGGNQINGYDDGLHPNDEGQKRIASLIYMELKGSPQNMDFYDFSHLIVNHTGNGYVRGWRDGESVHLFWGGLTSGSNDEVFSLPARYSTMDRLGLSVNRPWGYDPWCAAVHTRLNSTLVSYVEGNEPMSTWTSWNFSHLNTSDGELHSTIRF